MYYYHYEVNNLNEGSTLYIYVSMHPAADRKYKKTVPCNAPLSVRIAIVSSDLEFIVDKSDHQASYNGWEVNLDSLRKFSGIYVSQLATQYLPRGMKEAWHW